MRIYVRQRAAGKCEGCGEPAPFLTPPSSPTSSHTISAGWLTGGRTIPAGWLPFVRRATGASITEPMGRSGTRQLQTGSGSLKSPERLLNPAHLYSRAEVLERPGPVPPNPGVYAGYFRDVPGSVALEGCHVMGDATLLYVGIAPRLFREGLPASRQTLRSRLRYHYRGNAEGSTLRLTLGCLLANTLGLDLRRVGSGKRLTFGPGEAVLSAWMGENAFVTWVEHPRPWEAGG